MVKYSLLYFDSRGLAEMSRLILHYSNIEFEDKQVTHEAWPEIKSSKRLKLRNFIILGTPFHTIPVLTIDDKVEIPQSFAIARLLANRYELAGKDDVEAALLDSIADLYKDFMSEIPSFIYVALGRREGDKDQLFKDVLVPAVDKFFPFFVKAIKNTGNGFFGKSGVSWVDFFIASGILTIKNLGPDALTKYPELVEHSERVHALPQLQKYLSTRKHMPI